MSHFIIGRIQTSSDSTSPRIAQQVSHLGGDLGFTVRLLAEIDAQLQFEIFAAAGLSLGEADICFDIVSSLSGTADELISPYVLFEGWPLSVKDNLEAIIKLASDCLSEPEVIGISIVFSEGFDTDYEAFQVVIEEAVDFLIGKFSSAGEIPSLLISIQKPENQNQ